MEQQISEISAVLVDINNSIDRLFSKTSLFRKDILEETESYKNGSNIRIDTSPLQDKLLDIKRKLINLEDSIIL